MAAGCARSRAGSPLAKAASASSSAWHRFWPDSIPYQSSHLAGVLAHRQVTDAYLVALARHHVGRVVSFDKGLAALHGDSVFLLGT